jgi:hypothetical protein
MLRLLLAMMFDDFILLVHGRAPWWFMLLAVFVLVRMALVILLFALACLLFLDGLVCQMPPTPASRRKV